MNTCDKYWWVTEHPAFINKDGATVQIEIDPHMVCPSTGKIEDYHPLNTKLQLWIEVMVPFKHEDSDKYESGHDYELDCGGWTYEEAIDNMYNAVLKKYGDYTQEELDAKFKEVYNFITKPIITAKSRKLHASWRLTEDWKNDVLDDNQIEIYSDDIVSMKKTIQALTEHRKTCSIDEYEEIDEHLEKETFKVYEAELSVKYGIDLVRK